MIFLSDVMQCDVICGVVWCDMLLTCVNYHDRVGCVVFFINGLSNE